jgi:hypothetical protein
MAEINISEDEIIAAIKVRRGKRTKKQKVEEATEKTDEDILKERKKQLALLRLGNKMSNFIHRVEKEEMRAEKKTHDSYIKLAEALQKIRQKTLDDYKRGILTGLKGTLAKEAEGGPEVPGGKGGGGGGKNFLAKYTAIAIGLVILTAAIHKAVSQSKIIGVIVSSISKALGLLIDLILLPFLPIITWGIIQLYNSIMEWNKWWGKTDPNDPLGVAAALMQLPYSLIDMLVAPIGQAIGKWIADNITTPIITDIINYWEQFAKDWNAFWADPLAGLKEAWDRFWGEDPILAGLKKAFDDFIKWLREKLGLGGPEGGQGEGGGIIPGVEPVSKGATPGFTNIQEMGNRATTLTHVPAPVVNVNISGGIYGVEALRREIEAVVSDAFWRLLNVNKP